MMSVFLEGLTNALVFAAVYFAAYFLTSLITVPYDLFDTMTGISCSIAYGFGTINGR